MGTVKLRILQSYVPGGINSRVSDFFEAAKSVFAGPYTKLSL